MNQLPREIRPAFNELKVQHHLRAAGFKKKYGLDYFSLFRLVFALLFHQKNWFRLLESDKFDLFPGKDVVYRFLNQTSYNWRRFLTALSSFVVDKMNSLTSSKRVKVFIFDDSMFERNRSKSVELLARFKDHATGAFYKGFRMLTMGWSDGHSFVPLDFSLLSSRTSQIKGTTDGIDKRTCGYKRRQEAMLPAPQVIPAMIDRALAAGATASHVLMDSWFTHAPLIQSVIARGLHVIGMVKNDKKRYLAQDRRLTLKEIYAIAPRVEGKKQCVLRAIRTELAPGIPVFMVFVRHRTNKNEWLAILSTDLTLSTEEVIEIYGMRWDIEVFFKCTKSLLRLQKEFQGRSYDLLVSHTTIVFSRYILMAWQHRQGTDNRSFGGLFYLLCDEVSALDWAAALQKLIELVKDVATASGKKISKMIRSQLQHWISGLPSYIKAYLPILSCES